jgi:RNA polymerase sigma factor (sigma-70 family)
MPNSTYSHLEGQSDNQLMALYIEGQVLAFEVLYARHKDKIYGYLSKRLNRRSDVDEVFQDVFLKLHKNRDKYRQQYPFLPWLFTLTQRLLIDFWRKNKNLEQSSLEESGEVAAATPQSQELPQELDQLKPREREAIEMRFQKEASFEEMAEHWDTSESNARKILSRALKGLKALLTSGGSHES